jgi:hypothetical protein
MSFEVQHRIDQSRYPIDTTCMFCGSDVGHTEEVWTGATEEDKSGWEVWFCCHPCRDIGADSPCETFYPIRLTTN